MIGHLTGIGVFFGFFLGLAGLHAAPVAEQAPESNPCPLMAGPHEMLFSGYAVSSVPRQEFCQDIAETGRSVLTLDAISRELRDMWMEIRVIRDSASGAEPRGDLSAVTLAHLPARKYPSGTVTFPVDFDKPGSYLVLVRVTDEHGWVDSGRLPLSVGEGGRIAMAAYALLGLAIMGIGGFYIRRQIRAKG